ncbi:MAG: hypothetical protein LBT39_07710 [Treponema sp.]|nr:hypothetical protein [Treponema sp.]
MLLIIAGLCPLASQDAWNDEPTDGEEAPIEDDWAGFLPSLYSPGDQVFSIALGIIVPSVFAKTNGDVLARNTTIGGAGSLSYDYFLGSHFFVGGELQGMFAATLGDHTLYIIPISLRAGYQFVLGRFEFPLSMGIGIAPQMLQAQEPFNYLGLFVKPRASVFFRFNPDWSFGVNTAWWWVPQITAKPEESVHGHFFEATIAARYHF